MSSLILQYDGPVVSVLQVRYVANEDPPSLTVSRSEHRRRQRRRSWFDVWEVSKYVQSKFRNVLSW